MDATYYKKGISNFHFNLLGKFKIAFFNNPIMMNNQILVHRWVLNNELGVGLQMDLTRGLVSSVVQAMCISASKGVLVILYCDL